VIAPLTQSKLFQEFWKWAGAVNIRIKVLGIVLSAIVLLGTLVIYQMRVVINRTMHDALFTQGLALTHSLVEQNRAHVENEDYIALARSLEVQRMHYSGNGHNTHISYLVLEDQQDNVLAASQVNDRRLLPAKENIIEVSAVFPETELTLRMGMDASNIPFFVNQVTFQLLSTVLIMVAVGIGAAFFLTWLLTHPIYDLVEATKLVAEGDFSPRVTRWADDEIGELAEAFNRMTAETERIRMEREQLRAQFVSGVIAAQEEERKRISRELHDSTSQSLTSVLVGLKNLQDGQSSDSLNQRFESLQQVVRSTLDEVRMMAWQLRPSVLDDLGLVSALQRFISDFQQRYNIQVDLLAGEFDGRLTPEMETTIYRIVQESLANVAYHAQATTASVILDQRRQMLRIIIEDNGAGFDPDAVEARGKHLGLQGIRERAMLLGGSLTIESEVGHGTTLFIEIPLWSETND
jgi:signal transduction histidine kinase